MTEKIFTMETYRYNTDKKIQATVHTGRFEENRDSLTPVMIKVREFYARNKKHAQSKVRKLAKVMGYKFVS